jgi:hydrogenase maturation protease
VRAPRLTLPVEPGAILVLGLGNTILQDEGLGVRALERLAQDYALPPRVRTLDGGIMGLDLLPFLAGDDGSPAVSGLLVLDAVQTNRAPGALVRLEGAEIRAALGLKMSMHQVGLQELLAVAAFQGTLPPRVVVWGMEPAALGTGCELSPLIEARLPLLVEAAATELQRWTHVGD